MGSPYGEGGMGLGLTSDDIIDEPASSLVISPDLLSPPNADFIYRGMYNPLAPFGRAPVEPVVMPSGETLVPEYTPPGRPIHQAPSKPTDPQMSENQPQQLYPGGYSFPITDPNALYPPPAPRYASYQPKLLPVLPGGEGNMLMR